MYYFQLADVNEAERPEYEVHKNSAWETLFSAETADDLLCLIIFQARTSIIKY